MGWKMREETGGPAECGNLGLAKTPTLGVLNRISTTGRGPLISVFRWTLKCMESLEHIQENFEGKL